jgi:hypothetical protein
MEAEGMFVVVLFTTILKQNDKGVWEPTSVTTTTIPGFKNGNMALAAANALNLADEGPVQRRAFAFQQE